MFNVTTVLPHNLLQTNPCIRHNFSTQVFRKRADVGPELRYIFWPPLYQSVHQNVSVSLLHSLFLHKAIQLSSFHLQSTARCPPFYKLVTSIAFSMNYNIHSHVCNISRLLWRYNFNGMIKWYDISWATLCIEKLIILRAKQHWPVRWSHHDPSKLW